MHEYQQQAIELLGEDATKRLAAAQRAEIEADGLEKALNNAMGVLFTNLPQGQKRYRSYGQNGRVYLCRFNAKQQFCARLEFVPSEILRQKLKLDYVQTSIGEVNLRDANYSLFQNSNVPKTIIIDTETVLQLLGFAPSE